jgi:hypothetical protein
MYQNNVSQTVQIDLSSSTSLSLKKKSEQGNIFGIEVEIAGTSKNNIGISLSNGQHAIHQVRLKKGEIDFVYKNDWYTDSLFLNFEIDSNENGTLEIAYRFLGL